MKEPEEEKKAQAPFVYFGGKARVAGDVWKRLGNVTNYVEPFCGSCAMLLNRPDVDMDNLPIETINDSDGFLINFWRALKCDPESVAFWSDNPVSEIDLNSRHAWLVARKERLAWSLEDPDFYDVKIAGWWCWGINSWVGSGWCAGTGPHHHNGVNWVDIAGVGVNKQMPNIGTAGKGVNKKRPHLGHCGVGVNKQIPRLNNAGVGVNKLSLDREETTSLPFQGDRLLMWFYALADRLKRVRIVSRDWSKILTSGVLNNNGKCGIFLDPPYTKSAGRMECLYTNDSLSVGHDVAKWAIENGDNANYRIALCGYEGEYEIPDSWETFAWKTCAVYGSTKNAGRERIWFSPHCLKGATE